MHSYAPAEKANILVIYKDVTDIYLKIEIQAALA